MSKKKQRARALHEVLAVLDGWIEGAKENHEALYHRGELAGEECWTRFHPQDIRNMVDDAARALGVADLVDAGAHEFDLKLPVRSSR